MRSIEFNGHDFSAYTTAEVLAAGALSVEAEAAVVPGRPGAALLGGRILPREVRVRLFMDIDADADADVADARAAVRAWLAEPAGGELVLPTEPGIAYRDAVCVDATQWGSAFPDGACEVTFLCFDPIGYGSEKTLSTAAVTVDGTWRTWPTFEIVAAAGTSVKVADGAGGAFVEIARAFSGGEEVVIDCELERAWVDGEPADADVAEGGDFFWLDPGAHALSFTGASDFTTRFTERYA